MGFSFRKSIKIAPGVRLNLSKKGISASVGGKGITYNTRGRATVSAPGTGLSYSTNISGGRSRKKTGQSTHDFDDEGKTVSKRQQANDDFLATVQEKTTDAMLAYFYSHGICVDRLDASKATTLPNHAEVFNQLKSELDQVEEATRLLTDIGSLPLATKQKTMQAVYEIEKRLAERQGDIEGLEASLIQLHIANDAVPKKPRLWLYIFWGLMFVVYGLAWKGFVFVGLAILVAGVVKRFQFKKKKALSNQEMQEANAVFNEFVRQEITPRNEAALSLYNGNGRE